VRVIGTASEENFDMVSRYGGIPVAYGAGLEQRVREAAPGGVVAAVDAVGTDEAVDVSLALVNDRKRIVTIAAFRRGPAEGLTVLGQANPDSGPYRAAQRLRLLELAAQHRLEVPMAQTFAFDDAKSAFAALMGKHPPGKLALVA
jgi:NADPH:quinone reductase-like Zn-dependent oxidoreductase